MKTTLNRPQFTASKFETEIISRIANRAVAMAKSFGAKNYTKMRSMMDLEACHCNGCPLDLERLEKFPDFDFSHDVFGIAQHIDVSTGELKDCFVPRCAL